jgi:hypothetical protein
VITLELTTAEARALTALLAYTVEIDENPLSKRVQIWRDILAKLKRERPLAPSKVVLVPVTVKKRRRG